MQNLDIKIFWYMAKYAFPWEIYVNFAVYYEHAFGDLASTKV